MPIDHGASLPPLWHDNCRPSYRPRDGLAAGGPRSLTGEEVKGFLFVGVGVERQLQQRQREQQREQRQLRSRCAFLNMIMSWFEYESVYRAYLDCRKNKRNTSDALLFELDAEEQVFQLHRELTERRFRPSTSSCFVTQKPKLREIFAADFRDRITHHLLVRYLEHLWEPVFIYDSYASRPGKGIHLACERLQMFTPQSHLQLHPFGLLSAIGCQKFLHEHQ